MPLSAPPLDIIKATQRLNPCYDLDVDVLAVVRAGVTSTPTEWGTPAGYTPDSVTGAVRLNETTPVSLFSQTTDGTVQHHFTDAAGSPGAEEYGIDVFPDPSVFQGVPFTLASIDLTLGVQTGASFFGGFFRVTLYAYDDLWHKVPIGDPIDIDHGQITNGAVKNIDFRGTWGRRFVFAPGMLSTKTGSGRDNAGNLRIVAQDNTGASTLIVARGLSIGITPMGRGFQYAWIGCGATSSVTAIDPTTFWRTATGRQMGPYDPTLQGANPGDTGSNPDGYLGTGAIPGYGAIKVANGWQGVSRRLLNLSRSQDTSQGWQAPYFNLKAVAYSAAGSPLQNVIDLGATPANPVQLRIDDQIPNGTTIAYTLDGSADNAAWTGLGTVIDGQVFNSGSWYRYYRINATFTPGPTGATKYVSPVLQAWSMVERTTLSTLSYLDAFDASSTVDPLTGQSGVGELVLTLNKPGRRDYRDLATRIATNYSPSQIEAHVYGRNTRSGTRWFLNSYRLENREPKDGAEQLTFLSGLDRLSATIPGLTETYRFPVVAGQYGVIQTVTGTGGTRNVVLATSPFTAGALNGFRYHGVTGNSAGVNLIIQTGNNTNSFVVAIPLDVGTSQAPVAGDTFEIHSDVTARTGAAYTGQDFAAIYEDILRNQAAIPSRLVGALPATTSRTGTATIDAQGAKALDVIESVALNAGGFIAWRRGRIDYCDLFGRKDAVVTWTQRHYTSLETVMGGDRRIPSVRVKYGYNAATQKFTNEATYDDFDTLTGLGRSNLFDVYDVPDSVARWCDVNQAKWLVTTLQNAWKNGVFLWKLKTAMSYPHVEFGDGVGIVTDQFTARRMSFSPDGLTDLGQPVLGFVNALGVVVGKNLWSNEWLIAVRGLDAVTGASPRAGGITGSTTIPGTPVVACTFDNTGQAIVSVTGDANTASIRLAYSAAGSPTAAVTRAATPTAGSSVSGVATAITVGGGGAFYVTAFAYNSTGDESPIGSGTFYRSTTTASAAPAAPLAIISAAGYTDETQQDLTFDWVAGVNGGSANYSYTIKVWQGKSIAVTYSGTQASNALPRTITIARNVKFARVVELTVTDTTTGLVGATARTTLESSNGFLGSDGFTLDSLVLDNAGRPVSKFFGKGLSGNPDTADSVPNGVSYRVTSNNEATGGGRGFNALDSGSIVQASYLDFSRGYTNKHAVYLPRSGSDATPVSTIVQSIDNSGNAAAAMLDSGARAINKFFGKGLSGNPDTADSVPNGVSYRVPSNAEATGGGRGYQALDATYRLTTGVQNSADVVGMPAATLVAGASTSLFRETFDTNPFTAGRWNSTGGTAPGISTTSGIVGPNALYTTAYGEMSYATKIPYNRNKLHRIRCRIRQYSDGATQGVFYVGIITYDNTGAAVGPNGGRCYICVSNVSLYAANGWQEYTGWFSGASGSGPSPSTDPLSPSNLNTNAVSFLPYVILNYANGNGAQMVDYIEIDVLDEDASKRTYTALDISGNAQSTMQDSGGRAINRFFGKGLSSSPDNADTIQLLGGVSYRVPSNAEATGGGRGYQALDAYYRIADQSHIPMVRTSSGGSTPFYGGGNTTNCISTVTWNGSTYTANIPAWTMYAGSFTKAYNSGTVAGLGQNLTYYIYCDDPNYAGGAVTYYASTTLYAPTNNDGRVYVGAVTTGSGGSASTTYSGGSAACFESDTLISMADGSLKPIAHVQVDDEVVAFDPGSGDIGAKRVTAVLEHEVDSVHVLITRQARVVTTAEHPFHVSPGKFRAAGELRVDDRISRYSQIAECLHGGRIINSEPESRFARVYNLEVEDWHTYIAAGYAVHNVKLQ